MLGIRAVRLDPLTARLPTAYLGELTKLERQFTTRGPCLTIPHQNETPSGTEISISDVTFSGFIQMPILEQDKIITTIKQKTHGTTVDSVVEEALERIRAGWQDRGYFKAEVSGEGRTTTKTANSPQVGLFVHVDENVQYRLGRMTFKNNRAISNLAALRSMIPVKDGDIFSREKITKGLENLRKAYGQFGYIKQAFPQHPWTTRRNWPIWKLTWTKESSST